MSGESAAKALNRQGNNFDGLRLLLSFDVVLFHMVVLSRRPELAPFGPLLHAEMLIPFFISISGFLIVMSYEQSKSTLDYFQRRFRRILPAYYSALLFCAVIGIAFTELPIKEYITSLDVYRYLFWNALYLNYLAPYLPGVFRHQSSAALNGAIWTVKVELTVYVLVPFMVAAGRRWGRYLFFSLCYVLSVIYVIILHHWPAVPGSHAADLIERLTRQFPGQISFFVAGAILYYRWRSGGKLPWWTALIALLTIIFLKGDARLITLPACAAIIAIYIAQYAPYVGHVARYGDFSYGLFVFHYPIVQAAIALGVFKLSPWIAVPSTFATVMLAAVLSWRLVERPSLSRARVRRTEGVPKEVAVESPPSNAVGADKAAP